MSLWYILSIPCWLIVIATSFARLRDMTREEWGFIAHVRRLGLALSGTGAAAIIASPFTEGGLQFAETTWRGFLLAFGWSLCWISTPNMVPWWELILGAHREGWESMTWWQRLFGEARAIRTGFTPRRNRKPLAGPKGPLP